MAIDPIGAIGAPQPVSPVVSPPASTGGASFAATLQAQLSQPRAEVAQIRAEVASLRNGGVLRRLPDPSASATTNGDAYVAPSNLSALLASQATGNTSDAFGWRQMSRDVGDQVIGPGYGALFERQIQQESGFAPDVVYGLRRSSAGAEGIAQLMPQYYPGVARSDPRQGLLVGARTMQDYLSTWHGDVRKALASYNAGIGRVQGLVNSYGNGWETGLPVETRQYLAAIVGNARPQFPTGRSVAGVPVPPAGPLGPEADGAQP